MFNPQNGAQRTLISAATAEQLQRAGVLVADHRRSRPLWFDGRFLAARDLNREQDYFLTRQADLSEAAGSGIADGLLVLPGNTASELQITPGHGIANGGVRLQIAPLDINGGAAGNLVIDLASLAEQTQLNAAIGLSSEPAIPDRVRSGLFVVALRPIEFSANAIGRYPTQPGEQRGMQDGEIIEASLVTLIPFPLHGTFSDDHLIRSAAARSLFLEGKAWQPPINCLPLAIIRLQRNQIRWIDPWLVRRAVGEMRSDPLGLGLAPRPARIAFLRQYQQQLYDVIAERRTAGLSLRFPASDYFNVLPPAGPLPVEVIADAGDTLVQHYFPAEMDVDLAIVPEDELATVMEESFTLPPIPLTGSAEELAATGVLILLPIKRTEMAGIARRPVAMRRPVLAARSLSDALMRRGSAVDVITNYKDINERMSSRALVMSDWYTDKKIALTDTSGSYRELGSATNSPTAGEQESISLDEWRKFISQAKQLWYVRRRNLSFKDSLAGAGKEVLGDDASMEEMMVSWLKEKHLIKNYDEIAKKTTTSGNKRLFDIFAAKAKANDDIGARAAMSAIVSNKEYDEAALINAAQPFNEKSTMDAISRISELVLESETDSKGQPNSAAIERNRTNRAKLAQPETVFTLRKIIENVEGEKLDAFATMVKSSLKSDSAAIVGKKIQAYVENL